MRDKDRNLDNGERAGRKSEAFVLFVDCQLIVEVHHLPYHVCHRLHVHCIAPRVTGYTCIVYHVSYHVSQATRALYSSTCHVSQATRALYHVSQATRALYSSISCHTAPLARAHTHIRTYTNTKMQHKVDINQEDATQG